MSHEIDMSNGRANMAYAGDEPWHGLGFKIDADASIGEWQQAAGLEWTVEKAPVMFQAGDDVIAADDLNRSVLYRSDTKGPLSIMSTNGFHVVQPDEILGFIGDSVRAMGWKMETAGSLRGGRKIWALANIGEQATIGKDDVVKGYLLAATACDGSMASEFLFTSTRVVCKNTLHIATSAPGHSGIGGEARVKVYHFNKLDVASVKAQLGIASSSWSRFIEDAKRLAAVKLTQKKAVTILRSVYEKPAADDAIEAEAVRVTDDEFLAANMTARHVLELYKGEAIGAQLASAKGTAWGLLNACTEHVDHRSLARSVDNRLNSAWFGPGAVAKQRMLEACLDAA